MTSAAGSLALILPFFPALEPYMLDPEITEIMVNPGPTVFVTQAGRKRAVSVSVNPLLLKQAIKQIARQCRCDVDGKTSFILDARLEDGSRVAAVLAPVSVDGDTLTIRKFGRRYSFYELVNMGMLTSSQAEHVYRVIMARGTVLISGGTDTGKTTLLNALVNELPAADRIAIIEDTAEIWVTSDNLIRFAARPETAGELLSGVSIADLLKATLRHAPDRIVLGEVRDAAAWDLLQALNTGHSGSLSTIHANSSRHALTRFAHLVLTAGHTLPYDALSDAIRDSVALVVHLGKHQDGERRVVELLDVQSDTLLPAGTRDRVPASALQAQP